jgi:endonuclease/exonuclease/phosphatase family metal-dependent hydrolase
MGDYNTAYTGSAYKAIAANYQDCMLTASITETGNTYNQWGAIADTTERNKCLDYCFISSDIVANKFEICRDKWGTDNAYYISDHYAILTNIKITKQ